MKTCSPQLENGHTRIANELLEAIYQYPFNGTELKVILAIIRLTYGWARKATAISYSELANLINTQPRYVKKVIKELVQDNVIHKKTTNKRCVIGINKHYNTWRMWITQNPQCPMGHQKVSD